MAALVGFLAAIAPAAMAAEPAPTPQSRCQPIFNRCEALCRADLGQDSAEAAGCATRCGAERALCEALAAVDIAQPWLERQFDRFRRFYDGYTGGEPHAGRKPPPSKPTPKPPQPARPDQAEEI